MNEAGATAGSLSKDKVEWAGRSMPGEAVEFITHGVAERETILAAYAEQRRHLDELVQDGRLHLVTTYAAEAADVMIQLGEMDEARASLRG